MIDRLIDKYINNEASEFEKQQVRSYILEDFEQLTDIMLRMRQRAMKEMGFREDALLKKEMGQSFDESHPIPHFAIEAMPVLTADFDNDISRTISLQDIIKDWWKEIMSE